MEILHVSAECYPVAKAGGLGDVVGSLPRFQQEMGHLVKVVMPMYRTSYLYEHEWELVHKGAANLGHWRFDFTVIREKTDAQGFTLYLVDINGLLDREKIYGYDDDTERFCAFQIAVLSWLNAWTSLPSLVHVHDHHTALIPFMMQYSFGFNRLSQIPTVLTIHNAQYQGVFGWDKTLYIPQWDSWKTGLLEWNGLINPLASGVRCAWKVTTVSPSYMGELGRNSNGLEALFEFEKGKCTGILNGIDHAVWDPSKDRYLSEHYTVKEMIKGKAANKQLLCAQFGLDEKKPLFVFIGRLVGEKGADLLTAAIRDSFEHIGRKMNFLVLGSGEPEIESGLSALQSLSLGDCATYIGYNERLSHLMYAGADFLLMPSRVEPCGLNQLYAMRYGTIPVVRSTGGLRDTVIDLGMKNGYGLTFLHAEVGDITHAVFRAVELYGDKKLLRSLQKKLMKLDFSWSRSAKEYVELYQTFQ
jgi:starch synthase